MSNLSTLPKGDSAWLLRRAIQRIMQQVSVLETNIGSSTTGNSADTQVIFNDNGTLRGDSAFVFDATTDMLSVTGFKTFLTTQLSTIGILYVGTLGTPKLKVDVAGTGITTITQADITGAATVGTTLGVTGNLTASSNIYVPASTTYKVGPLAGTWAGLRFDSAKAMILDSDTSITFRVNGGTSFSTAGSIDTSGNLNLNTGNVVMATSGKGIDFSATPGTGTSELLNDYEEGNWTAGLTDLFGNDATVSAQTCRYTKIGRRVFCSANITLSNKGAAAGGSLPYITGLPFAAVRTEGSVVQQYVNTNLTTNGQINFQTAASNNVGNFTVSSAITGTTFLTFVQITNTTQFVFCFSYDV